MQVYGELQQFKYNYQSSNCTIASTTNSLLTNSSVAFTSEAIPPKLNIINKEKALREEVITQLIARNLNYTTRITLHEVWDQNPQFPNLEKPKLTQREDKRRREEEQTWKEST